MGEPFKPSYEFGPFVLDVGKRLLRRNGDPVPLAPKVLDTLLALIERRCEVVSKDHLLSRVWGDTVVEEGGLARNISLLRKTLGETPEDHRYIVTVPARGYRFVADVREGSSDEGPIRNGDSAVLSVTPARDSTAIRWAVGVIALVLVAGAALVIWRSDSTSIVRSGRPTSPALIRLTSTSGLNTDPALSPDGTLVAYASDRAQTGNLDIWVQPVRGGNPTRITSAEGDETEPSFSPDGAWIAFSGGETGGIHTVGALGGEPHLIVPGPRARMPRFSPDGQSILYWVGQTAWIIAPGEATRFATAALAVVPSSGGAPRALARDFSAARYGVWSPDGKKILFLGDRSPESPESLDWYVIEAAGGTAVRTGALEAVRAANVTGAPIPGAWTAQGVVFTTTDATTSNVYQLPVSPQTGHVAGSIRRLTFGSALERGAAVSAAGHIAFTTLTENIDIWRVPLDSRTGIASGAPERLTDDAAKDEEPDVSAAGRTMAFRSSRTGRNEIWLKDLETGAERQLTHTGVDSARIAPDGLSVAVESEAEARVELYDLSSGRHSILCEDCMFYNGWSSDGSRLLIGRRRGAISRLIILDLNSKREVEVTEHPAWHMTAGRFSPDDRWVVFNTANAPNFRQSHAVPTFRETPVPVDAWVTVVPDFAIYPNWSSDGTGIYHFSFRDGHMCAWLQDVDPQSKRPIGPPRAVQHFHQPRLRAANRSPASSVVVGGALYVTLTETSGNIWMLDAMTRPGQSSPDRR
jgi:eukaryotic-like serine/threonine-protein kinase